MKKIVKVVVTLVLLLGIATAFANDKAEAATTKTAYVKISSGTLNVRSGAGTNYKIMGSLKKNAKVTVYAQKKNGWSEIRYKGKKAYVSTKYLNFGVKVSTIKYKGLSALKYPKVSGLKSKTAQKNINNAFLTNIKKSYKFYLEAKKLDKEIESDYKKGYIIDRPYAYYKKTYSVKYNDGKKLSILVRQEDSAGGIYPSISEIAYNYDVKTGKKITLDKVITSKSKQKKFVKYLKNYNKKHDVLTVVYSNFSDIKNSSEFVFTKDGIALHFQMYSSHSAMTRPVIKIPASVYK